MNKSSKILTSIVIVTMLLLLTVGVGIGSRIGIAYAQSMTVNYISINEHGAIVSYDDGTCYFVEPQYIYTDTYIDKSLMPSSVEGRKL